MVQRGRRHRVRGRHLQQGARRVQRGQLHQVPTERAQRAGLDLDCRLPRHCPWLNKRPACADPRSRCAAPRSPHRVSGLATIGSGRPSIPHQRQSAMPHTRAARRSAVDARHGATLLRYATRATGRVDGQPCRRGRLGASSVSLPQVYEYVGRRRFDI